MGAFLEQRRDFVESRMLVQCKHKKERDDSESCFWIHREWNGKDRVKIEHNSNFVDIAMRNG
jgi:hypothetical protein